MILSFNTFINEASSSSLDLDRITYGNPPLEYIKIMQTPGDLIFKWFKDNGLIDKILASAPANSSPETRKDLEDLIDLTAKTGAADLAFARHVDSVDNLAQAFIDLLAEFGIEETMGNFFAVDSQTEPLLHWLKHLANRPRPYQLARAMGVEVYPLIRTDAMSAAWPSGHALTAFVMSQYFAGLYPQAAEPVLALGEKIARSREITGIHFPSDTRISRQIAAIIIEQGLLQSPGGAE